MGYEDYLTRVGVSYRKMGSPKKDAIMIALLLHILVLLVLNILSLSDAANRGQEITQIEVETAYELPSQEEDLQESSQKSQEVVTHRISSKDEKYDIKKLRNSLKSLKNINNIIDKDQQVDLFSPEALRRDIKVNDTSTNLVQTDTSKRVYTGASTIYFSLKGRYQRYIPNPVYTCPKGGKVVVIITVNQYGKVIDCEIDKNRTKVRDQCLYQAALSYTKKSIFSTSGKLFQKGYISYQFQ